MEGLKFVTGRSGEEKRPGLNPSTCDYTYKQAPLPVDPGEKGACVGQGKEMAVHLQGKEKEGTLVDQKEQ